MAEYHAGLEGVRRRITPGVTLIAVSKTFAAEDIRPVLRAGQRVFGENRVQEARAKWPELKAEFAGVELHLIGPLQTNKVRDALKLFDVIQTLDRPRLAQALAAEETKLGLRRQYSIEVNTGAEPQKAGVLPQDADSFIRTCRDDLHLDVMGLMGIPPAAEAPAPHFDLLAAIARRNGLASLSMGMSGDFETAIAHGATHVRVGSAIFGVRG